MISDRHDDHCGSQCADELPKDLRSIPPGYKRALWIVVSLNAGYGLIEMGGGFIAGSQAVKADALDFLGDGTITLLGLLAVDWRPLWRARLAFLQGLFLAGMGVGVLGFTFYRTIVLNLPEAEIMGGLGAVALLINVLAAAVLIPHRKGDAGVRAVWLFSRNDAIGNLVVVIAAVFVGRLDSPWPDLVAAIVIAGLFLQSACSILTDALRDLRAAHEARR